MQNISTVDLSNWQFSFGGSDVELAETELYQEPTIVKLATPIELLLYLANDDGTWDTATQNRIRERLEEDPVTKVWHGRRTKIGKMPHFQRYRESDSCDEYHAAAAVAAAGSASLDQQELVHGLNQEIAASKVIVPANQVLFHGRGDRILDTSDNYPSFISTSLHPIVCMRHAIKRKNQKGLQSKAFVYALTLRNPLPAIWGNGGKKFNEWELLLRTNLRCSITRTYSGMRFDVVEATLG